ncbi:MAG: hypothetical protein AB7J28_09995 [Hyphomonadaceae bacterium]
MLEAKPRVRDGMSPQMVRVVALVAALSLSVTATACTGVVRQVERFEQSDLPPDMALPDLTGETLSEAVDQLCSWIDAQEVSYADGDIDALRMRTIRQTGGLEAELRLIDAFLRSPGNPQTLTLQLDPARLASHTFSSDQRALLALVAEAGWWSLRRTTREDCVAPMFDGPIRITDANHCIEVRPGELDADVEGDFRHLFFVARTSSGYRQHLNATILSVYRDQRLIGRRISGGAFSLPNDAFGESRRCGADPEVQFLYR